MKIRKFKKKPVVIEACQFDSNNISPNEMDNLVDWMNESGQPDRYPRLTDDQHVARHDGTNIYINTLEGEHRADVKDWIIKGIAGEFYPIKEDIFFQTYEPVEES